MTTKEVTMLLMNTLKRIAAAKDKEEPSMDRCECYYTMGQVRHVCPFCEARECLKEVGQ